MHNFVLDKVNLNSKLDRDSFLEWLNTIPCMEEISEQKGIFAISIAPKKMDINCLEELRGVFLRFNIEPKQLERYVPEEGLEWLYDQYAYSHDNIYPFKDIGTRGDLVCSPLEFYSTLDEDIFFKWLKGIDCIVKIDGISDTLHIYLASNETNNDNLLELISLFYRSNINMKQLARLLTDDNKLWFYDNKQAYWHNAIFGS